VLVSRNSQVIYIESVLILILKIKIMLCIYILFNDAVSSSDYMVLNVRMIVNNEFERLWNEMVVA
jgi:hypothetical protein